MLLEEILAKINELPEDSRAEVLALAQKNKSVMKWAPNPGPQTDAFFSNADETFYGGQAGGGKTTWVSDWLLQNTSALSFFDASTRML